MFFFFIQLEFRIFIVAQSSECFGVSCSVDEMSRPGVVTSDLIQGICVPKVSLWILTVVLNVINNAEGASEWIREASVVLIKVSREQDRWNERFRGKRYDIRE